MKYKVGDIVKLRDDLESDKFYKGIKFLWEMQELKYVPVELSEDAPFDRCYRTKTKNDKEYIISEEMIEGLWEECKSSEQVSKLEGKLRLIDILNKIANGELKEGTRIKTIDDIYEYNDGDLMSLDGAYSLFDFVDVDALNEEAELIEPNDFGKVDKMAEHNHFADDGKMAETNQFREDTKMIEPECEHKWKRYSLGRLGQRTENHRYCSKCGADEIETTDNTKIEELELGDKYYTVQEIIGKLNEVIRYINK